MRSTIEEERRGRRARKEVKVTTMHGAWSVPLEALEYDRLTPLSHVLVMIEENIYPISRSIKS